MKIEVGKKYVAGGVQFVALAPIPDKEAIEFAMYNVMSDEMVRATWLGTWTIDCLLVEEYTEPKTQDVWVHMLLHDDGHISTTSWNDCTFDTKSHKVIASKKVTLTEGEFDDE